MKLNIYFFISFLVMLALTIIVVFFLNKFLFFIHGFDMNSTNNTTVDTFKAYKTIYKSKVLIIISGLIISIILLVFARKLSLQNPYWEYQLAYGICWVITIIFIILNIFLVFLPKGPLV